MALRMLCFHYILNFLDNSGFPAFPVNSLQKPHSTPCSLSRPRVDDFCFLCLLNPASTLSNPPMAQPTSSSRARLRLTNPWRITAPAMDPSLSFPTSESARLSGRNLQLTSLSMASLSHGSYCRLALILSRLKYRTKTAFSLVLPTINSRSL
ncbi:hypothetical protein GALMADRAFT_1359713 [Galerina marginata CBS 339.88]|uniref:Uncharacterized protein n=1 Tax=Galerina marginata (strain CBS 339.88) TaxID=685588 RepID=A0A067S6T4_GALM3|nr:hypothetical protein GALMADRAFT_1359713 [Galerina marginata CBS 339.88]